MAKSDEGGGGAADVVLMVCVACGWEVQLEPGETPPAELECEKCGNEVFRRFDASATPGEAESEFLEETERDTDTDDPAPDTERGDLLDLNNP
jgi:predicted RNA-binding Zn-ribbon protein involved in translation (DUF1610 family)